MPSGIVYHQKVCIFPDIILTDPKIFKQIGIIITPYFRTVNLNKERGIEVLLTYLPFPAWEEAQKEANRVYDIAAEYGVEYINFLELDLINYKTDCSDDQHINLSGGRKVTEYLGQYIIDHYDVADHRNNAAYENWHEDYRNYRDNMVNGLYSYTSLDYYLLYLYDKEYLTFIEINSPEIWSDYYADLFENPVPLLYLYLQQQFLYPD